jgi:hypothetical protein
MAVSWVAILVLVALGILALALVAAVIVVITTTTRRRGK